ncbi:hypothetical protein TNCV_1701521 [Trichonephila clavipes]|nr:hypothetical protein TNCV_1701521 [Trichonephila clavipes]
MVCDAEDCEFQMLNDDVIVTSVQEESDPADDEKDEYEENNNESSKGPSNADTFSAFRSGTNYNQSAVLLNYCCSRKSGDRIAKKKTKQQEMKLPVRLINITNERRQVQGHETPLRMKGETEKASGELDNGV